jgi:hypothetical protein
MAENTLTTNDSIKILGVSDKVTKLLNCEDPKDCLNDMKNSIRDIESFASGIKSGDSASVKENIADLSSILGRNKLVGEDIGKARLSLEKIVDDVSSISSEVSGAKLFNIVKDLTQGDFISLMGDISELDIHKIIDSLNKTGSDMKDLGYILKNGFYKFEVFYETEILPTLNNIEIEFTHSEPVMKIIAIEKDLGIDKKVNEFFNDVEAKVNKLFGIHHKNKEISHKDVISSAAGDNDNSTEDGTTELHQSTTLLEDSHT